MRKKKEYFYCIGSWWFEKKNAGKCSHLHSFSVVARRYDKAIQTKKQTKRAGGHGNTT
jgi:predicted ATP-dependent serine protease